MKTVLKIIFWTLAFIGAVTTAFAAIVLIMPNFEFSMANFGNNHGYDDIEDEYFDEEID